MKHLYLMLLAAGTALGMSAVTPQTDQYVYSPKTVKELPVEIQGFARTRSSFTPATKALSAVSRAEEETVTCHFKLTWDPSKYTSYCQIEATGDHDNKYWLSEIDWDTFEMLPEFDAEIAVGTYYMVTSFFRETPGDYGTNVVVKKVDVTGPMEIAFDAEEATNLVQFIPTRADGEDFIFPTWKNNQIDNPGNLTDPGMFFFMMLSADGFGLLKTFDSQIGIAPWSEADMSIGNFYLNDVAPDVFVNISSHFYDLDHNMYIAMGGGAPGSEGLVMTNDRDAYTPVRYDFTHTALSEKYPNTSEWGANIFQFGLYVNKDYVGSMQYESDRCPYLPIPSVNVAFDKSGDMDHVISYVPCFVDAMKIDYSDPYLMPERSYSVYGCPLIYYPYNDEVLYSLDHSNAGYVFNNGPNGNSYPMIPGQQMLSLRCSDSFTPMAGNCVALNEVYYCDLAKLPYGIPSALRYYPVGRTAEWLANAPQMTDAEVLVDGVDRSELWSQNDGEVALEGIDGAKILDVTLTDNSPIVDGVRGKGVTKIHLNLEKPSLPVFQFMEFRSDEGLCVDHFETGENCGMIAFIGNYECVVDEDYNIGYEYSPVENVTVECAPYGSDEWIEMMSMIDTENYEPGFGCMMAALIPTLTEKTPYGFYDLRIKAENVDGNTFEQVFSPGFVINSLVGVETIAADQASGRAVYYNLQGQRVTNPAAGLYIKVEGGKSTKILVK